MATTKDTKTNRKTTTETRKAQAKAAPAKAAPKPAEASEDEDAEEEEGGSVVPSKYQQRYKEAGHPRHCGDSLATTLNELCLDEKGRFILDAFEAVCKANECDISMYARTGNGWQGRLRMSGRNKLAKIVAANEGKLALPGGGSRIVTQ